MLLILALVALASGRASAEVSRADGSHGRVAGDLAVAGGLGATIGPRAPRATADVRLRYLQMAGVFATYEDGALFDAAADPRRVLSVGVEARPLFFGRWLRGLELERPMLDLAIDSFALEVGACFLQPPERGFAAVPGLQAGLGLEIPLLSRASGLALGLHGGVRWSDAALGGAPIATPSDRSGFFALTLGWQQIFGPHVVGGGAR